MEQLSLTPATQAVLDALTELGHGNIHELADKSGKARSTTDKAIKALTDAGVIVAVEPDPDQAEGTATRWTLAAPRETTDAEPDDPAVHDVQSISAGDAERADPDLDAAAEPGDVADPTDDGDAYADGGDPTDGEANADDEVDTSEDDDEHAVAAAQPTRPGDRKVMAIKGVLADHGDEGATLDAIVSDSGIGHPTASRLLTAMEQADAARRLPGTPERWIAGPTKASEVDPNPEPPRCPLCYHVIRGATTVPGAPAAVRPLIRPDGTLHIVGPDGETHVVTLPTRTPLRAPSVGVRSDATVNADGSQPFGRGELEKLTLDVLAANPGQAMTPQEIATAIGAQLGRTVSSGAVRNNCTKAAAAGRIVLVSSAPLTFAHPAPADSDHTAASDAGEYDQL